MNYKDFTQIFNTSDSSCSKLSRGNRLAVFAAILLCIMALGLVLATQSASAVNTTSAYELTKLDKRTIVHKDHSYDVTQTISVNLPNKLDELSFVMPSGSFRLTNLKIDGKSANIDIQNNKPYITITNKNSLTKGKHDYVITYRIEEYEDRNEELDLFYYDALLPEWRVPISILSIYVEFPQDFPWDDMNYYAGQFGSKSKVSDLVYIADKKNKTVRISGSRIPQNYSVTIKAQLPNGYWEGAIDRNWIAWAIPGAMLIALGINLVLWLIGGRDPRFKKRILNKPIEGIYPSDTSYIFENKVTVKDLITLILYMATKGYLKISEYHPKKYRFLRVTEPKGEEKYIRSVYNTLFEGVYEQRYLESEDICPRMREIMKNFEMSIEAGFSDRSMASCTQLSKIFRFVSIIVTSIAIGCIPILTDLYQYVDISLAEPIAFCLIAMVIQVAICARYDTKHDADPRQYYVVITLLLVVYVAAINYLLYQFYVISGLWYIWIVAFLLSAVLVFFGIIMKARGKGNAELCTQLKGLRKWINNAGPQHVAPLQVEDPQYYYSLMPYALQFQALETWAKAFRGIHIQSPDWYVDDIEGHAEANLRGRMSTLDYAKDVKFFARTIEDEYETLIKRYHRSKDK